MSEIFGADITSEELVRYICVIVFYIILAVVGHSYFKRKAEEEKLPKNSTPGILIKNNMIHYQTDSGETRYWQNATYEFSIDGCKYKKTFKYSGNPPVETNILYRKGIKDAYPEDQKRGEHKASMKFLYYILIAPLLSSLLAGIVVTIF